jgi:multidrug efflux pump subunit AcrB
VRRSLEVIYYCFWTNTPLNGSYTGLIMIVGIISENAILPIYSLKRHLLVRMIKKQSLVITSTRLRPKLMTALGSHYCIITFSD